MPKIITRYVCYELSKVLVMCLCSLTLLLVIVGVVQEGIRNGLTVGVMIKLVPFVTLNALCFAVPGTVLFCVCAVFGRMSSMNEITAIKSLGISPWVVIGPAILFAIVSSLIVVIVIDVAFSWGYHQTKRVVAMSVAEIAYSVLSTQRSYTSNHFSIRVSGVDDKRLLNPMIEMRNDNNASTRIIAREAEIETNAIDGTLTLVLTDGLLEMEDQATLRFPNTIRRSFDIAGANPAALDSANPSHMWLWEVPIALARQRDRIEQMKEKVAVEVAYDLLTGNFSDLTGPTEATRADQILQEQQRLQRLQVEPHRRWASGFSCLGFAVIGIPLAMRLRTSDIIKTFAVCFLPILIVYYPLFALGLDRAKSGAWPPYSVWLGNAVCLTVGIYLFSKVLRH